MSRSCDGVDLVFRIRPLQSLTVVSPAVHSLECFNFLPRRLCPLVLAATPRDKDLCLLSPALTIVGFAFDFIC